MYYLNVYKSGNQVFSVLQLFKYVKSYRHVLQSFCAYWLISRRIYRRLSTHLDSVFTKKLFFSVPNTAAARRFARVGFILTISKCAGPVSLPYEDPSNYYCFNPHKSGNRTLNYYYYYHYF